MECSPYVAMLRELAGRVRAMPRLSQPFAELPTSLAGGGRRALVLGISQLRAARRRARPPVCTGACSFLFLPDLLLLLLPAARWTCAIAPLPRKSLDSAMISTLHP